MSDVIALRAHLVAEAQHHRHKARVAQQWAARYPHTGYSYAHYEEARRCTDAWLAADARLRALDALIARCERLTTGIALAADAIGARHQLAALEGREDEAARDALVVIREAT